jgi:DNA-binding CsgD family transcriptional regulator
LVDVEARAHTPLVAIRRSSYLRDMARLERLAPRDVEALLRFAAEAGVADGPEPFGIATIDRLALLVPADQVGYYEYRIRAGRTPRGPYRAVEEFDIKQPGGELPEVPWNDEILAAWWRWPLNDFRNRRRLQAARFSDSFATSARKRRNSWRELVMRPNGIGHEIDLWLPAPSHTVRAFFLVRDQRRRDFSERDRTILTLLRPRLASIREHWQRRHRPSTITPREAELLKLLRTGLTNREIAAQLFISPATVRTHLSNLFEKLGVHTRTAAASHDFAAQDP